MSNSKRPIISIPNNTNNAFITARSNGNNNYFKPTRKILDPMDPKGFPQLGPDPTLKVIKNGRTRLLWNFGTGGTRKHRKNLKKHKTSKRRYSKK